MHNHFINFLIFLSSLVGVYFQLVTAKATNYTIDDTNGDNRTGEKVAYQPSDPWRIQTCKNCTIRPEVTQFEDRTYHEAISGLDPTNLNITIRFKGE